MGNFVTFWSLKCVGVVLSKIHRVMVFRQGLTMPREASFFGGPYGSIGLHCEEIFFLGVGTRIDKV
jgi:hypothetical protein